MPFPADPLNGKTKEELLQELSKLTLAELKARPAFDRYHYLDQVWFMNEGLLAHLLPDNEEGKAIYNDFAGLRFRIHDLLVAETMAGR